MDVGMGLEEVDRALVERLLLAGRILVGGIEQGPAGLADHRLLDQVLLGGGVGEEGEAGAGIASGITDLAQNPGRIALAGRDEGSSIRQVNGTTTDSSRI
jgi:hypothetical protein